MFSELLRVLLSELQSGYYHTLPHQQFSPPSDKKDALLTSVQSGSCGIPPRCQPSFGSVPRRLFRDRGGLGEAGNAFIRSGIGLQVSSQQQRRLPNEQVAVTVKSSEEQTRGHWLALPTNPVTVT